MIIQLQLWPLHSFLSTEARMILLNYEANHLIAPLLRTFQQLLMSLRWKAVVLTVPLGVPCGYNYFWLPVWPRLLLPLPYYTDLVMVLLRYANCVPPSAPLWGPFLLARMILPQINRADPYTCFKSMSRRSSLTFLWTTGSLRHHTLSLFSASCLSLAFITDVLCISVYILVSVFSN